MTDEKTLKLVIPAISLNYKVSQDRNGKLLFENDSSTIYFDCNDQIWILIDSTGCKYPYINLKTALIEGA